MKIAIVAACVGMALIASCRQNPENGGEEIRGNEQRSDTAKRISNYPNEGDSGNGNSGNLNSNATPGARKTEGTRQDSQKTKRNPLYKGDNSDTGKLK